MMQEIILQKYINFKIQSVPNMTHIFYMNQSIQSLDLSSFITNSVVDFSFMFYGCPGFKVKKVKI